MSEHKPLKVFASNRKANFKFKLLSKYEAGIQLLGSEVKSIREGNVNIKESYVKINKNELYVVGMHIGEYSHSGYSSHDVLREKKILLHKLEISKIIKEVSVKGKTIVPTKVYVKKGKIKLEISIAEGKKMWDKREDKKDQDIQRRISRYKKGF